MTSSLRFAEKLQLITEDGDHISWVSEQEARDLIRSAEAHVELLGSPKRIRILRLTPQALHLLPGPLRLGGPAYSHCHETNQNPRGVWTFRRLHPKEVRVTAM